MFNVYLCVHYQACSKESHISYVKRIMKHLKETTSVGLWCPKGSLCDLVGYSYSYYVGWKIDRNTQVGHVTY